MMHSASVAQQHAFLQLGVDLGGSGCVGGAGVWLVTCNTRVVVSSMPFG
jgi:hypothetical protein